MNIEYNNKYLLISCLAYLTSTDRRWDQWHNEPQCLFIMVLSTALQAFCSQVLTYSPSGRFAWGCKFLLEIAEAKVSSTKTIKRIANNLLRCLLSQALVHGVHLLFPLLSDTFVFGSVKGRLSCSFTGLKDDWNTKPHLLNYPNLRCTTVHIQCLATAESWDLLCAITVNCQCHLLKDFCLTFV